jgi:long-subunit fatty acid transport protein
MRGLCSLALLTPCAALSAVVQYNASDFGGSPVQIGAGARALGMGGAFVAIADDATASTWNPAGITQLERIEAAASGGYYRRSTRYNGGKSDDQDVEFDHASAVYPLPTALPQTLALSWQRQYDFTSGQQFEQRDRVDLGSGFEEVDDFSTEADQDGSFAAIGFSYAVEPLWGLSIGATLLNWSDAVTGAGSYDKNFRKTSDLVFTDGVTEFAHQRLEETSDEHVTVEHGWSAMFGAMWNIDAAWTVAATYKPGFELDLERARQNTQTVRDLVGGAPTTVDTSRVDTSDTLILPTSAAVGAAFRIDDYRTISADVTWTRWRELASEIDGGRDSPVNHHVPPRNFAAGYAVRLGYEHIIIMPRLIVIPRAGLLYEQVPGSTKAPSIEEPELVYARLDDYYGGTLGLSLFHSRVLYDFAGQVRHAKNVVGVDTAPDRDADVTTVVVRAGITVQF